MQPFMHDAYHGHFADMLELVTDGKGESKRRRSTPPPCVIAIEFATMYAEETGGLLHRREPATKAALPIAEGGSDVGAADYRQPPTASCILASALKPELSRQTNEPSKRIASRKSEWHIAVTVHRSTTGSEC